MNESTILAKYAVETRYEDLPDRAREMAKMSFLDALGVTLAASSLGKGCQAFVDIAGQGEGKKESTILGFQKKVPAPMAAFANGSMAHALDFEDAHDQALVHPNAVAVPVTLALAESMGDVDGKAFITALAVGCDLVCRLGLAFKENPAEYGWYIPPILGAFGATAAAGRLLGLSETEMVDAFSLTLCQATCSAELRYSPESDIRAVRDAFAAKAALLSALLAKKGIKGFDHPFEGKAGLFSLYSKGHYDSDTLLKDLGKVFEGANVSFKPWPTCRGTHTFIEAAFNIIDEENVRPEDISDIRVIVSSFNQMLCEPLEVKRNPQAVIDAKFSIPFVLATALVYGNVTLDHFVPESLKDDKVLRLAQKIRYELDASLGLREATRAFLEIKTRDNMILTKQIDQAYGHPDHPISKEALVKKFMDCAAKAVKKIPENHLEKVVELILGLEELKDIRKVVDYLR
ncbi:MAG: MmgE/PrpD family protein [Deltaproteobacteria bacterium]|nr:MmgE/PrpD family protein [Deltaproteobacteria bacterium]